MPPSAELPSPSEASRDGDAAAAPAALDALDRVERAFASDPRLAAELVTRPHPLLLMVVREELSLVFAPAAVWDRARELLTPHAANFAESRALLYLLGNPGHRGLDAAMSRGLGGFLTAQPHADELYLAVERGFELLDAKKRSERRAAWVMRYEYELGELVDIARAMTTERDVGKLLGVILAKSRFVTGADAGSIYVVEGEAPGRLLRFKLTQNDSVSFDSREFLMPVNSTGPSRGGRARQEAHLARRRLRPPARLELRLRPPLRRADRLPDAIDAGGSARLAARRGHRRHPAHQQEAEPRREALHRGRRRAQSSSPSTSAARSSSRCSRRRPPPLENALLYDEIRLLFEGFVKASVEAIESRDPTTSGHSRRVADLTVGLAKVVDHESAGPFRDATFTAEDLRELEYASLLHDFGKIGVREQVLVKANKLYDHQLTLIRSRFDYVARTLEADILARKVRALERGAGKDELAALDAELTAKRHELEQAYGAVVGANEPTVVAAGDFARIETLAMRDLHRPSRRRAAAALPRRGHLAERQARLPHGARVRRDPLARRAHVPLPLPIPWGKQFRRVPVIAAAHHERLNGTGYPNRLRGEEIPLQSKLMSIADIFDALTANDRPYKKAVPVERALDILRYSVRDGHLDAELVRIFQEARVWESSEGPTTKAEAR